MEAKINMEEYHRTTIFLLEAIAKKIEASGGGNAIVVSHGMTIGTFLWLIDPTTPRGLGLDNGSMTVVSFEKGKFTIESIGDVSYRLRGRQLLEERKDEKKA